MGATSHSFLTSFLIRKVLDSGKYHIIHWGGRTQQILQWKRGQRKPLDYMSVNWVVLQYIGKVFFFYFNLFLFCFLFYSLFRYKYMYRIAFIHSIREVEDFFYLKMYWNFKLYEVWFFIFLQISKNYRLWFFISSAVAPTFENCTPKSITFVINIYRPAHLRNTDMDIGIRHDETMGHYKSKKTRTRTREGHNIIK